MLFTPTLKLQGKLLEKGFKRIESELPASENMNNKDDANALKMEKFFGITKYNKITKSRKSQQRDPAPNTRNSLTQKKIRISPTNPTMVHL